jgi:hypothetical protein
MDSETFVRQLRNDVVDDEAKFYADTLTSVTHSEIIDPYWIALNRLYDTLSLSQKSVLLQLVRQVSVDTAANILGIIDGVCYFDGVTGSFSLKEPGGRELAGDLQEHFFMQEKESADN